MKRKKIRVDFVSHYSVIVEVEESDFMYEDAQDLAQSYIDGNPEIVPVWEIEDGGVDDADEDSCVDVKQNE